MSALSGYRTLIAAVLVAAIGGVCAHFGWGISPDDRTALAFEGAGLLMVVLRHITSGPASWRTIGTELLDAPEVQALLAEIEARAGLPKPPNPPGIPDGSQPPVTSVIGDPVDPTVV